MMASKDGAYPGVIERDDPAEFHMTGPCPNCYQPVGGSGVLPKTPDYGESVTYSAQATCAKCGALVYLDWHSDPIGE